MFDATAPGYFGPPSPETVYYASTIDGKAVPIPLAELERRCEYQHTEQISFQKDESPQDTLSEIESETLQWVREFVANPQPERFEIRFMGDTGHGLYTRNFLPARTIVGFYSGEFLSDAVTEFSPYRRDQIDAKRIGGLTRFVQHMPFDIQAVEKQFRLAKTTKEFCSLIQGLGFPLSVKECADMSKIFQSQQQRAEYIDKVLEKFRKEDYQSLSYEMQLKEPILSNIPDLATANLICSAFRVCGRVFSFYYTWRAVKAGEQLGISYGAGFLRQMNQVMHEVPVYFDSQGIIPKAKYLFPLSNIYEQIKLPVREGESDIQRQERALRYLVVNAKNISNAILLLQHLLEHGVNINAQDSKPFSQRSALHWAFHIPDDQLRPAIVQLLLDYGADIDLEDWQGWTPRMNLPNLTVTDPASSACAQIAQPKGSCSR